jgi:hypothetical protein
MNPSDPTAVKAGAPTARAGEPPIAIDIVSNGVRIYAEGQGIGDPTIVFLHCWGG